MWKFQEVPCISIDQKVRRKGRIGNFEEKLNTSADTYHLTGKGKYRNVSCKRLKSRGISFLKGAKMELSSL